MNQLVLDTFLSLKQNWPHTRTPNLQPIFYTSIPLPSELNKDRIFGPHGLTDEYYITTGLSDLKAVLNIAELYGFTGGYILDWGVGCGRMFRHLPDSLKSSCIGLDIDLININWCVNNIPFGVYGVLEPYGKFNLESNSIDLVYSHSVMTHLCEAAQFHWLAELNRVLKGTAIISVHGLYSSASVNNWINIPEELEQWLQTGIKDSGINNEDIKDITPDLYYKDIAHTPKYIKEVWGQYINVVDVIHGGFSSTHDAVICTPKRN
jgi:hypothetical protein